MAFSLHAHLCAEHVAEISSRVGEMREPPLGLEATPHAGLEVFFDEIKSAPSNEALLLGLYAKALPALKTSLERDIRDTNPLADHTAASAGLPGWKSRKWQTMGPRRSTPSFPTMSAQPSAVG